MKKKLIISFILSFILFIFIFGLSYAYFIGNIVGTEDSTTITGNSGIMQIQYDGGPAINVSSFFPSATAFATKNFTVTGNNSTDQTMYYNITLVMESNTFSYDALKYKLTSTNTGGNGSVIPSITTMKEIGTGARDILLGNGSFTGATDNKVHTYKLELFFPVTGGDQSHDQSKSFSAHIEIEEGEVATNPYLNDYLISQYGGSSSISVAPAGTFDIITGETENVMYKMEDDYGMSYYLRGAKDYVNNNIIFAGHQWKIVRINGNGSVRLIYNGTCPDNSCTINSTGTITEMSYNSTTKARFNTSYDNAKYVGYMYQTTVENDTNSTIKTFLDNWYINNIDGTSYENYISDTVFCNDRSESASTYYSAYDRIETNKAPILNCFNKTDRFTKNDLTTGNGALAYPIGLITADEASIAGFKNGTTTTTNFLYTNQNYWTLSPYRFQSYIAREFNIGSTGGLVNMNVGYTLVIYGVRGVINLKPNIPFTGTGTTTDPYVIE